MGKAVLETPVEIRLGKSFQLGMLIRTTWKKDYSYLCMWMTSKLAWKKQKLIRCGRYSTNKSIGENQHLSLITFIWVALNETAKRAKILSTIAEICLNFGSPPELKKNYLVQGDVMQTSLHGPMIWKVTQRNVWSVTARWLTKQLSSFSMSQLHALITIKSKKNWDLLENCQNYALEFCWKVCTWHALVDQTFYGL